MPSRTLSLTLALWLAAGSRAEPPVEGLPAPRAPEALPAPTLAAGPLTLPPGIVWASELASPLAGAAVPADANVLLVHAESALWLDTAGRISHARRETYRVLTGRGVAQLSDLRRIAYDPAYQVATVHQAGIRRPGPGGPQWLPAPPARLSRRPAVPVYPDQEEPAVEAVVPLPDLRVGDEVILAWTVSGTPPEYAGEMFARLRLGHDAYPAGRLSVAVAAPAGRPLHAEGFRPALAKIGTWAETPERTEGGFRVRAWELTDVAPPPRDEGRPPREELQASLSVSTFADWAAVGRWCQSCRPDDADPAGAMADLSATAALAGDPLARAAALALWVKRNVRYRAWGQFHAFTPHPPAGVLRDRRGDCKDSAHLLATLYRAAGFKAEIATLGARGAGQVSAAVPSPWATHALVVVRVGEAEHWIDTTDPLTGWDELPPGCRDRVALAVGPPGTPARLTRTPPLRPDDAVRDSSAVVTIGPDRAAKVSYTRRDTGLAAAERRQELSGAPPAEAERLARAWARDALPRAEWAAVSAAEAGGALALSATGALPGLFRPVAGGWEAALGDGSLMDELLARAAEPGRTLPLELASPGVWRQAWEVAAPPGYRLADPPATLARPFPGGTVTVTVEATPARWRVALTVRLESPTVAPADFEALALFQDRVPRRWRLAVTLRPTNEVETKADLPLLEAASAAAPADVALARLLNERLIQVGRAAEGLAVLRRCLAQRPDDRELAADVVRADPDPASRLAALRALATRFPDDPTIGLTLADALATSGDGPAALKAYRQAEPLAPEAARTAAGLLTLGRALRLTGDPAAARVALEESRRLRPDGLEALRELVALAWEANDAPRLRRLVRDFAEGAAADRTALAEAAGWLARLEQWDEAFDAAARAAGPAGPPAAHRVLGLVLARRGKFADAARHLSLAGDDIPVLVAHLEARLRLGELAAAEKLAVSARPADRADPRLAPWLASVERLSRLSEAASKRFPNTQPAGVCAAEWLSRGEPAVAESLARSALTSAPADALARSVFARCLLATGRVREAAAEADRAAADRPADPWALAARGKVRLETGRPGAAEDLTTAVAAADAEPVWTLWLAQARHAAGDAPGAVAVLRAGLAKSPGHVGMAEQLRAWVP